MGQQGGALCWENAVQSTLQSSSPLQVKGEGAVDLAVRHRHAQ